MTTIKIGGDEPQGQRESNSEFIERLMTFPKSGPLMQGFIMTAIENYARWVKENPIPDNGLISGQAWTKCADELAAEFQKRLELDEAAPKAPQYKKAQVAVVRVLVDEADGALAAQAIQDGMNSLLSASSPDSRILDWQYEDFGGVESVTIDIGYAAGKNDMPSHPRLLALEQ